MDCGWERMLRGEAIGHRRGDIATFGQFDAEGVIALTLAGAKASAVDAEDRGERPVAGLRSREVELQMLIAGVRVFDRLLPHDRIGNGRRGFE